VADVSARYPLASGAWSNDAQIESRSAFEVEVRRLVALAAIHGCGSVFQLSTSKAWVSRLVSAGEVVIIP